MDCVFSSKIWIHFQDLGQLKRLYLIHVNYVSNQYLPEAFLLEWKIYPWSLISHFWPFPLPLSYSLEVYEAIVFQRSWIFEVQNAICSWFERVERSERLNGPDWEREKVTVQYSLQYFNINQFDNLEFVECNETLLAIKQRPRCAVGCHRDSKSTTSLKMNETMWDYIIQENQRKNKQKKVQRKEKREHHMIISSMLIKS